MRTVGTRDRPRKCNTEACRRTLTFPSPSCQVPTSRECVGFGAVQEVAVGLVQPASAALYDYYSPGEHLGTLGEVCDRCPMWDIGNWGSRRWQGSPVAPQDWEAKRETYSNSPLWFSPENKCSVFYGAPTKSKLLSTLCSADVCQCAEGETQGLGVGLGR